MGKLMLFICVALLVGGVISASTGGRAGTPPLTERSCAGHGDLCYATSNCCSGLRCHIYAQRCQVEITPTMLQEQRRKLKPTGIRL